MMRLIRKNMMCQMVLTFVLTMLVGGMPATVLAETIGAFEVTGGANGTDYSYENGVLTILTSTEITIANTDSATSTTDRIEVAKGVSANIILKGVNIDVSGEIDKAAFKIADESAGNVKVTLLDGTENILKSGENCAGLQKNGTVGALEITGSGELEVTGGEYGAGIGGGEYGAGSNIIISGGSVTATGGEYGAGIGGGYVGYGSGITISGGSVKTIAGSNANNIGGGGPRNSIIPIDANGNNVCLKIVPNPDNEIVKVDGKEYPLSIHSEDDRYLYLYLHENSVVMLGSKEYNFEDLIAFDINGGVCGIDYLIDFDTVRILSSAEITISNKIYLTTTRDKIEVADGVSANIILKGVSIDVSGEKNKAAFKIADNSAGNVKVTLLDGTENILKSGENCAGLQKNGTAGALEITGSGSLEVTGGYTGAGIGGGSSGVGSNITISGGSVTATGGVYSQGAGIGGGYKGAGSNITISGGSVIATGGYGAGIGGGRKATGSNITISGGSVTATGEYGAGIGGGEYGDGIGITISGGSVTATGEYGAGIGGGFGGAGSNITVSGGSVKTIANGEDAITPVDANGNNVFLLTIANPNRECVKIDGEIYPLVTHSETDTNLYVYLPGVDHIINVGSAEWIYKYSSEDMSFSYEPRTSYNVESFVCRMYTVALNRTADETGKANWVAMLNAGTHDGAGIAREFILGAEFGLRGLSNEEFVDVLYQTFFNRAADAEGKNLWVTILESGQTREYVLSQFVNLDEFTMLCESYGIERGVMFENGTAANPGVPQFVNRLYEKVMGRDADATGLYNWVFMLVVKAETAESAAVNFFNAEEYALKNTDSAAYVTDLYSVFMDREADAEGLALWVSFLDDYGMTRDWVISEFAKSAEFAAIAASYGLQ